MRRSPLSRAPLLALALLLAAAPAAPQSISFSGAAWYASGGTVHHADLGDIDGDGLADIVLADSGSDTVLCRPGDGIGGLRGAVSVAVGDQPIRVQLGAVDGDLFEDLVVSHESAAGTWLLLADGLGGFLAPVQIDTGVRAVPALVDFDGDGTLDLALASNGLLRLRAGDGAGGFGAPTDLATGATFPYRLLPADLNGDAAPDLVLLDYFGAVLVFLGTGTGMAAPTSFSTSSSNPFDLAIARFDGDSHLDLAVSDYPGQRVALLFGDGAGGFSAPSFRSTGQGPLGLAAGDWDGDGDADLAVSTADARTRILFGDGAGSFTAAAPENEPAACLAFSVAALDLDSDGHPDLLCPDRSAGRLVVSLGDGTGTFTPGRTFPAGDQPRALAVAPFDGVPGLDLLVGSYQAGGGFRLLPQIGGGIFGPAVAFAPTGADWLLGAAADDLDGDGDQDAVVAALTTPWRVGVALGDGAGGFPDWSLVYPDGVAWAVGLGRLDADAWPDLVVHGRQSVNGVALLAGDGGGGFGPPSFYGAAGSGSTIAFALADLDLDGDLDVAHPNADASSLTVRLGDGAGALGSAATHAVTGPCNAVTAGDLDGDLDLDLVATGYRFTTFLQGTAATFSPLQEIDPPDFTYCYQSALADFDGDGDVDVALVGDQPGVQVYANDGSGTLSGPIRFGTSRYATNLHAGDLDGDSLPDLVATLYEDDRVIVLRNNARRMADLAVAVDDGQASAVPGEAISYTVTVTNLGPALVGEFALPVLDTPPLLSPVFTPGAGSYTPATGAWTGVELRHGESVALTLEGTIDPWVTGTQTVSATAVAPATMSDPVAANNTSWDEDALTPGTDLALAKSDGQTSAVAGLPIAYTLTVTNHGPSAAPALTLLDPPPALLLSPIFTPERGSYDPGTGAWSGALLGPGESVTLALDATVDPGATGDLLTNTASLAAGPGATDPDPANDTATDVDALVRRADLALAADNGRLTVAPGEAVVYILTLVNGGPGRVDAVALVDTVPPALLAVSHTPATGSYEPASGAWTGLALDPGESVTMAVAGTVDPGTAGVLSYSAVVFPPVGTDDPVPGDNVAADHDPVVPEVDLAVSKSDGREGVWPGETVVYAIAVANPGPSHAPGTAVADAFPAATLAGCTWTCAGSGGAACPAGPVAGDIATTADLPAGSSVLFTATCTATAAVGTDPVVNTATATPAAGIIERDPADNTATDLTRPAPLFRDDLESGDLGEWSGGA